MYQERIFLHLIDDTEENRLVKNILKSPMGLASDIIKHLFDENLGSLRDSLDDIKRFVAGITRARNLGTSYSLALYYPYMFSFHQYFHSSYRARQGKVLEEMLRTIICKHGNCDIVPSKISDVRSILTEMFNAKAPNLDVDVMGVNSSDNKAIIVQLRSRDDTGGTTAKGSLVDMLRGLLRINKTPRSEILYLVCIWDARDSQQKRSTIEKMYSSLKDFTEVSRDEFFAEMSNGIKIRENIYLKMAYGTDEIVGSLFEWTGGNDNEVLKSVSKIVDRIENWDDLWISYATASLELEVMCFTQHSNVKLLNEKCALSGVNFIFDSYDELIKSIDTALDKIIPLWTEDSIPLTSLSDKAHYIRDLLFLKACYEKLSN
ncbi:MAG: hypothetical protein ACT4NX_01630 [Deltaproteobacteria bacterium]